MRRVCCNRITNQKNLKVIYFSYYKNIRIWLNHILDYKSEFQTELKLLEKDLDHKISQITHFNQKKLKDNRELANAHNDETKELKLMYEEKIQKIREENKRSKETIKELISSREAELARINKEIDSINKVHLTTKQEFDGQITESKEEMKVVQKQRK